MVVVEKLIASMVIVIDILATTANRKVTVVDKLVAIVTIQVGFKNFTKILFIKYSLVIARKFTGVGILFTVEDKIKSVVGMVINSQNNQVNFLYLEWHRKNSKSFLDGTYSHKIRTNYCQPYLNVRI